MSWEKLHKAASIITVASFAVGLIVVIVRTVKD